MNTESRAPTPGPWKCIDYCTAIDPETGEMAREAIVAIIAGPGGATAQTICEVGGEEEYGEPSALTIANARLIASAPELLEALINLASACDQNHDGHDDGNCSVCTFTALAYAAIAKATTPTRSEAQA